MKLFGKVPDTPHLVYIEIIRSAQFRKNRIHISRFLRFLVIQNFVGKAPEGIVRYIPYIGYIPINDNHTYPSFFESFLHYCAVF